MVSDHGGQAHGWVQPAARSAADCARSSASSSTNVETIPSGFVAYATYTSLRGAFATTAIVAPFRCSRIHVANLGTCGRLYSQTLSGWVCVLNRTRNVRILTERVGGRVVVVDVDVAVQAAPVHTVLVPG